MFKWTQGIFHMVTRRQRQVTALNLYYTSLLLIALPLFFKHLLGDRLVKVNGASIIGKAYCEVISLIQDR